MVRPPDWVRPIWLGMRFCRTYTFKKTDPGQLNAARDLWFYSALPNVLLRLHLGRECYGLSIQPAVGIL